MLRNALFVLCLLVLVAAVPGAAPRGSGAQQAPAPAQPAPDATSQQPQTAAPESAPQPQQAPAPALKSKAEVRAAAWALLKQGVASEKARDRSDAVSALTVLDQDREAISLVAAGLKDKETSIRVLAAVSLGEMKARSAIPQLKDALDDDSAQVSFAAAQALWKIGDRSGRDILYEVLNGERKTGPGLVKGKMDKMRQEMHDPKALALIGINEASGAFLGPFSMGVSFIEEYAKNNSAPIQAVCAKLLSSDNSRDTVNELRDALADKNWAVRAAAARALAKMNHPEAIPQLRDMMQYDKEQPARFAAAAAIILLSPARGRSRVAGPPLAKPAAPAAEPAKK
jgi:HEAT repeat protein